MALSSQWLSSLYIGLISFGISFYLGRIMGPDLFGTYSYLLTIASLFLILQDGGYKNLLYREKTLTSSGLSSYAEHLFSFALGHAVIMTLIGLIIVLALLPSNRYGMAAALACFGSQAVILFVSSELKAKGQFARDALWHAVARTMSGVCIIAAVALLTATPFTVFAAWAVGLMLCLAVFAPVKLPLPRFQGYTFKAVRGPCLAFLVVDAATTVYYKCDIILLQHLSDSQAVVGQYAAAYRFLDGVVLLAAPLGAIWFRDLRLLKGDKALFRKRLTYMGLILLSVAVVILFLGSVFSREIIFVTFGREYASAALLLPWLLAALIFVLPNTVLTQAAIAQNKERVYAVAAGTGAVVNIGLNWILIPQFGAFGAAWATIATEGNLSLFLLWGLWRRA